MVDPAAAEHRNEVLLVGRLAAAPEARVLPSGDPVVSWRLVVERAAAARRRPRSPAVDTVDCVAFRADTRRVLLRAEAGQILEVAGTLRRRFWRSPAGAASRYEVEALRARRITGAGPPAGRRRPAAPARSAASE